MIELEVAGPFAMFARPDSGSTPISYPVPTYSAAKGMFEAVAWLSSVYINPVRVEICEPIRFERYITNYGGPLRKPVQIKGNNNYQLIATILVDVRYKLFAEVREKLIKRGRDDPRKKKPSSRRELARKFSDEFNRRLENGQTFHTPCLGWKKFVPSYFGPLRLDTNRDESVDHLVIPSLLDSVWENKEVHPNFRQNWKISKGVMSYKFQEPHHAQ
ncbi:MAG: CRISPR-associated protein Cas5 [Armatimonadetes bacterium]|nr:CRISPR-associated protein Cas5 [Armatimonadota bacterium]